MRKKIVYWLFFVTLSFCIFNSESLVAGTDFITPTPLLPPSTEWQFNDYWHQRKIGNKQFYAVEDGPYFRLSTEALEPLKQVGLKDRTIPGYFNVGRGLNNFDPKVMKTLSLNERDLSQMYVKNKWPIHTIEYCIFNCNPPPTHRAIHAVNDLWIGDSQPEEAIYRLEPIFYYIKTRTKWEGSSMGIWKNDCALDFFKNGLMPRLDKEMPFYKDQKHQWTRPELRKLSDLYTEEWFRPIERPIAWTMFLSPYFIASNPSVITVASKGADALLNAYARGVMRQSGGNKFYLIWRGHEPTEMYSHIGDNAWFALREEWGYPLPHVWYYIFRPYLIGANYYTNESFPPIEDVEGDGQYELSITGLVYRDMLDFVDRHPDRGVAYAPVALLLDYNRAIPENGWGSFSGYNMPLDDADQMNNGLLNHLIFPEHRHTRYTGGYSRTAPYGEIFDILSPNLSGKTVDAKSLENYKILFALGGLTINQDFAEKLIDYVSNGGTLVTNAADVGQHLPMEFLGVSISPEVFIAKDTVFTSNGHRFDEQPYTCMTMQLQKGAHAVVTAQNGRSVVSINRYGKGSVIVIGARYMIQDKAVETTEGWWARKWYKKALLRFVPVFFDHLVSALTPVEVLRKEEDREDLSWIISKKGMGWVVTLFNYSLLREPLVARPGGTAKVLAEYPYKEIPFQIISRVPVADVIEWYQDRDVKWEKKKDSSVISETMHGGEIRVYELQPNKIDMPPRMRYVNYALNKPVTASSFMKGYLPTKAVDGNLDNDSYWQSDVKGRVLTMPQWLEVDMGKEKTIDHILVLFHCWYHESLDTRLHIYKYIVEASLDGKSWQKVLDESKNEKNARPQGLERWFDPVQARYVRLTVLRNSAHSGAQVIEMKVMGPEKESYQPQRKAIVSH